MIRCSITMHAGAILCIENSPEDRELLGRMFNRLHVRNRLAFARDGEEAAFYLLGSGPFADRELFPFPDLVLLDIGLPVFQGFEVLEFIRDNDSLRELPVIMLSNSDNPRDKARAHELGADGYLTKTSSLEHLQTSLRGVNDTILAPKYPKAVVEFIPCEGRVGFNSPSSSVTR
jgi:CheY-like chemotaxis protein